MCFNESPWPQDVFRILSSVSEFCWNTHIKWICEVTANWSTDHQSLATPHATTPAFGTMHCGFGCGNASWSFGGVPHFPAHSIPLKNPRGKSRWICSYEVSSGTIAHLQRVVFYSWSSCRSSWSGGGIHRIYCSCQTLDLNWERIGDDAESYWRSQAFRMKHHKAPSSLTWSRLTLSHWERGDIFVHINPFIIYMLYLQPDGWITTRRGAGLASRLLNFMEDKAWASPGELGLLGIAVFWNHFGSCCSFWNWKHSDANICKCSFKQEMQENTGSMNLLIWFDFSAFYSLASRKKLFMGLVDQLGQNPSAAGTGLGTKPNRPACTSR